MPLTTALLGVLIRLICPLVVSLIRLIWLNIDYVRLQSLSSDRLRRAIGLNLDICVVHVDFRVLGEISIALRQIADIDYFVINFASVDITGVLSWDLNLPSKFELDLTIL